MSILQLDETTLNRIGGLRTAREIVQQPASWRRTQQLIEQQADAIEVFLAPLRQRKDLRIILTGAGSSSFIGECLAPFILQRLGRRVEAIATTDLLSGPGMYLQEDAPTLLVSFARTGNSPESVAVIELAQRLLKECYHLVFTCNEAGALFQRVRGQQNGLTIPLPPETHDEGFAATSSVTSMILAAWLVFRGDRNTAAVVSRICTAGATVLERNNQALQTLARNDYLRVVYLGSNAFKALAREAALKMLELTDGSVSATFDSPLGFRHGPKAIVSKDTLVLVFVSNDSYTRAYDLDLLSELRSDAIAGRVIAVTARRGDVASLSDHLYVEGAEHASDAELLLPYGILSQLYAFHRAIALNNTPDQPSRSGTVNRIVRGVIVHPYQRARSHC